MIDLHRVSFVDSNEQLCGGGRFRAAGVGGPRHRTPTG
jgi:hypothetical protein